tara:strand:- start:823 stop:1158 length:336 start_codon:yes stop_codon:yes gene_type:complete
MEWVRIIIDKAWSTAIGLGIGVAVIPFLILIATVALYLSIAPVNFVINKIFDIDMLEELEAWMSTKSVFGKMVRFYESTYLTVFLITCISPVVILALWAVLTMIAYILSLF